MFSLNISSQDIDELHIDFFLQGAVLYAHYGQTGDFKSLQNLNISSEGKIVLIRAGKISFAEKVGTILYLNSIFF